MLHLENWFIEPSMSPIQTVHHHGCCLSGGGGGGGIHYMTDVGFFVKYQTRGLLWLNFFYKFILLQK